MQHTVADYLSRLESGELSTGVRDDFPDAQLFQIEAENSTEVYEEVVVDLWITEMVVFLSTGLPLEGMALDEHKRLAVRIQNFCLLKETLYHKGADGIWRGAVRQFEAEAESTRRLEEEFHTDTQPHPSEAKVQVERS